MRLAIQRLLGHQGDEGGQGNLRFIRTFAQLYDFVNLLKWELAQPPGTLLHWITETYNYLEDQAEDVDLWHLMRGRFDELSRLYRLNPYTDLPLGEHPWPDLRQQIEVLEGGNMNNSDKVCAYFVPIFLAPPSELSTKLNTARLADFGNQLSWYSDFGLWSRLETRGVMP